MAKLRRKIDDDEVGRNESKKSRDSLDGEAGQNEARTPNEFGHILPRQSGTKCDQIMWGEIQYTTWQRVWDSNLRTPMEGTVYSGGIGLW